MYFELLCGSILIFVFVYIRSQQTPISKFVEKVGGPPGLPILGNTLDFIRNFDSTLRTLSNWIDEYGGRFVFTFGSFGTVLVLNNPKDLFTILTSNAVIEKSQEYDIVKSWIGNGLIASTGKHWLHRRRLITPTFHFSNLENFIGPFNHHANILVDVLYKKFVTAEPNTMKDICPFISRCTLDIICDTAMGKHLNAQLDLCDSNQYVEAVHNMGEIFQYRSVRPWLRSKFLWRMSAKAKLESRYLDVINSFTDGIIIERKSKAITEELEENANGGKIRLAFLDLLLEAQRLGADISDAGIREETTTFIVAGHDTVSVAISFCLFNIGNYPQVQEKLHQELDSIFKDNRTRNITTSDLKNLKYLECCIKESLRLFPSVPIIGRSVNKPFKLDDEVTVPGGVAIFVAPFKLHRNPKYFPNPDEFNPDRFVAGSGMEHKNPFAYVPFSAGPRNCIGQKYAMMEAKVVLATILRTFKIKTKCKPEEIDLVSEIVLRSRHGVLVQLEKRK